MSLNQLADRGIPICFPRVSGDEPGPADYDAILLTFSPRERG